MIPNPVGIPEYIRLGDWVIWCWTGWKGTKATMEREYSDVCRQCGKAMLAGQVVERRFDVEPTHWTCVYPDNRPDRLMGQWLAILERDERLGGNRYMVVNVDNFIVAHMHAGEYKRGERFPVSTEGRFITEDSPEDERDLAKEIGLQLLKHRIDEEASGS